MVTLLRIQEDDFGCEERPEGWTEKSIVTFRNDAGEERVFRMEDAVLEQFGLVPGSRISEEQLAGLTQKKGAKKMKVYGTPICIDCRNYKAIQKARGFEAEFVDITENTDNLRAFLTLRDTQPSLAAVRERHGIGIPLFVRDDGEMTLEIDEAMGWIGQPPVREEEITEHRPNHCASCH